MTPADYAEQAARMLSEAVWADGQGEVVCDLCYESAAMLVNATNDADGLWGRWSQSKAFDDRAMSPRGWCTLTHDEDENGNLRVYIDGRLRDEA